MISLAVPSVLFVAGTFLALWRIKEAETVMQQCLGWFITRRKGQPNWLQICMLSARAVVTIFLVPLIPLLTLGRLGLRVRVKSTVENRKYAVTLLDGWGAFLPARIAKEELGDYIEDIDRRAEAGQRWLVWVRVITAILWTGINTVGFVTKNLFGKSDKQASK